MAEIIKKHKGAVFTIGVALFLVVGGLLVVSGLTIYPESAVATTNYATDVVVTATVSEWLTFTLSSLTATLSPNLVNTAGVMAIGSSTAITLTIGTNATSGWSTTIQGDYNGLRNTSDIAHIIASVTATGTIATSTDGYGAKAATSTGNVTIGAYYGLSGALDVGEIKTGVQTFLSKSTANSALAVGTVRFFAACDDAQAPGSYTDTVTLTVTTSP